MTKNSALKTVHSLIKELHKHMMNLLGETEVNCDILSSLQIFEVLTTVTVCSIAFWNVTLCSLADTYEIFEGICSLHLQDF
jgi:hypothetical protein